MKIGVILPQEFVPAALAAGVDYVEPVISGNVVVPSESGWAAGPAALTQRRDPGFAVLFPPTLRLSDPGFDRSEVTAYLEAALPLMAQVAEPGAVVVLGSGGARRIPDDVAPEAGRAHFASVVSEAWDMARAVGLELVLEPLNTSETNLLHTVEEAVAFLDEFGLEGVRVVADLYHVMLEGEDLATLTRLAPRIGHAHVADTGRKLPGTGDWPIAEFLKSLAEGGYRGNVSIETSYTDEGGTLPSGVEHLRGLLPH